MTNLGKVIDIDITMSQQHLRHLERAPPSGGVKGSDEVLLKMWNKFSFVFQQKNGSEQKLRSIFVISTQTEQSDLHCTLLLDLL
jgi:hypothetical protein